MSSYICWCYVILHVSTMLSLASYSALSSSLAPFSILCFLIIYYLILQVLGRGRIGLKYVAIYSKLVNWKLLKAACWESQCWVPWCRKGLAKARNYAIASCESTTAQKDNGLPVATICGAAHANQRCTINLHTPVNNCKARSRMQSVDMHFEHAALILRTNSIEQTNFVARGSNVR